MATFVRQFEICASNFSKNTAVLYCNNDRVINKLTYDDLETLIDIITKVIQSYVKPKSCVCVVMEPNPILPAIILSVQKLKSSFFCIDTDTFTNEKCKIFGQFEWIFFIPDNSISNFNTTIKPYGNLKYKFNLLNDSITLEIWKTNFEQPANFENISYVIKTSGTTGTVKTVKVSHECIMSNINSFRNIFQITENDLIFLGTPVTFDPFIIELMLAITTGACLIIVPPQIKQNRKLLLQTLFPSNKTLHTGVTFLQMPPSVFLCLPDKKINELICEKSSLRILALGGEAFPDKVIKLENRCKNLRIFNLYGITEVSCWASIEELKNLASDISLGQPIENTIFQVRDDDGNIIVNGEGNLYIGSEKRICVIDDEILPPDEIVFRETGDIVRIDKNSNKIYYIGRKNSIIKRFGHRVCLEQIEKLVFEITDLKSFCIWYEITLKLVLFVVIKETDKLVKDKIIDRLRVKLLHTLPKSSNPDIIELITSIPLTHNGKVSRNCLAQIINTTKASLKNLTPIEIFNNLWSKYFGVSVNEIKQLESQNFFAMGGNSILAIQLVSEFDSIVENNSSGALIALLLDKNKCYDDYRSFISNTYAINFNKRSLELCHVDCTSKQMKLNENIKYSVSTDNVQLTISWKYNLESCVDAAPVYFDHSSLGGLIAVGSHSRIFVILNSKSGEKISSTVLPDAIEAPAFISPGKNNAFVGCYDGYIYCIKIITGEIIWKFRTEDCIKCSPAVTSDDENIIFGSYDKTLYCLSMQEGTLVWRTKINESIKSNSLVNKAKQMVYIASIQGTCFCLNETTGQIIWKNEMNSSVFGCPCLIDEENIILWADVKGHVFCFDCSTGDKLWVYKCEGFIYSSLNKTGRKVLFGCIDHNVYCLDCTRKSCVEMFKVNVGAPISTTPFIFSLKEKQYFIVAHNKGRLHLFEFESSNLLQTIELPGEVFSSPIVQADKIYVGCRDNYVYCVEIKI